MKNKTNLMTIVLATLLVIGIVVRYYYGKPKYVNGEVAPIFTSTTHQGKPFSLEQTRGQYVLLDFWGSWCPPCRAENQKLAPFYQKWKNQKLENNTQLVMVSVGIETGEKAWLRAITNDQLDWEYHVSDFQRFDSPLAKMYGVREIPTKILINPEGIIIGVNQDLETIDKILSSKLVQ